MEVADSEALEKKLRARQRGLAHQKKTLFGSKKFRQKAPTPPTQPARVVQAICVAPDEYDSERESRDSDDRQYNQDEEDGNVPSCSSLGQTPPGEPARRNFDPDDSGRDRPRCRHCVQRPAPDGAMLEGV
ncbi:hypothetical protein PR002_g32142 [Phytophthora rubi]|uniref:Uncharacterized protein n=1 Tax=Phytophthora rubi TaxID=129364 RepID=A0A6A3GA70_9STRA|nr:hypothetical protein PR002_g32142 [Phytophthora rubi]